MAISVALAQCSREGWPGVVEDLQAQLQADPRAGTRLVQDAIRDLGHQIGMLEYQLDRRKLCDQVREIWQRRIAVLARRQADLRSLLPVRAATTPKPASDDEPAPALS